MWIRSQDKTELIDTKSIQVDNKGIYALDVTIDDVNYAKIGEYASKERALEVLDMIQDRIARGTMFDEIHCGKKTTRQFVFQMPER